MKSLSSTSYKWGICQFTKDGWEIIGWCKTEREAGAEARALSNPELHGIYAIARRYEFASDYRHVVR